MWHIPAACGKTATGYTAAINQLSYGDNTAAGGPGDACGRCFSITGSSDPYDTSFQGPFNTIIVKITDECPIEGNAEWCAQTTSDRLNEHGMPVQ